MSSSSCEALAPRFEPSYLADSSVSAWARDGAGEGVVLWFFDRDLRVICEHTGQPHESEESTGAGV